MVKLTSLGLGFVTLLFFCGNLMGQQTNFEDLKLIIEDNSVERGGDRGGDGGGAQQSTSGGAGGGENEFKIGIDLDWADNGKMLPKPSKLNWKTFDANDQGPYRIVIKDITEEEEKVVLVYMKKTNYLELPFNKMKLKKTVNIL